MPEFRHCNYNFISVRFWTATLWINIYLTELSTTCACAVILILSLWPISSRNSKSHSSSLYCRYEKELMHPVKNLLSGELARALLIQVVQIMLSGFAFLDIETWVLLYGTLEVKSGDRTIYFCGCRSRSLNWILRREFFCVVLLASR